MKEMLRIVLSLTCVCLICALLLSLVASLAKEKIYANQKDAIDKSLSDIVSDCEKVEKRMVADSSFYVLWDSQENIIGYGLLVQGQGYQGKIKIMAVVDEDCKKLLGIEIIESSETPGLGAKINDTAFKQQFSDLSTSSVIQHTKEETIKNNQIKAISGATISSQAVVSIVNKGIGELKKIVIEQ